MSHPERAKSQKVTIEDILRLKRSERPSPEFWSRFEQELRAKQLAAIVEKRPWWITLRVPQATRYFSRFQVPVGAAAVLALSFVVVREYRPVTPTFDVAAPLPSIQSRAGSSVSVSSPMGVASVDSAPVVNAAVIQTPTAVAKTLVAASPVGQVAENAQAVASSSDEPASVGPGGLMAMIPWALHSTSASKAEAVTLGELPQVHFISAINPGRDHDFEGRVEVEPVVMPMRVAVAEVASTVSPVSPVVSPREVRRNRILSNLVVGDNASETEPSRLVQVREVLASALDDDRLYDSVRRLGMGGDRLTLKF